jgi:transposase-like protein
MYGRKWHKERLKRIRVKRELKAMAEAIVTADNTDKKLCQCPDCDTRFERLKGELAYKCPGCKQILRGAI